MTYMATPQQKVPWAEIMKATILVDSSLVIITIHLVFLSHAPEERERFFLKKYINITLFTPRVGGHEIYNFLSPYPTDATYQDWYSSS